MKGGKPCGSTPIVSTPWSCRSNALTATAASTTTTSTLGSFGSSRFSSRMPTSEATPIAAAVALASPCANPDTKARASAMSPSASTEKPRSLGSWPTTIVSASPFM